MARTKNLSPDANTASIAIRLPASTLAFLDSKLADFQAKNPGIAVTRTHIARALLVAASMESSDDSDGRRI